MTARRLRLVINSGTQVLYEAYQCDFKALWGSALYFRVMHPHHNMHGAVACYGRGMGDQWLPDPVEGKFLARLCGSALSRNASGPEPLSPIKSLMSLSDRRVYVLAEEEKQTQEEKVNLST